MSRPQYETSSDRQAELRIGSLFQQAMGWEQLVKLPISYRIDFAGLNGDTIVGWVEVKARSHPCGQYRSVFLSASKWSTGVWYERIYLIDFFLVVGWSDGKIGFCPCGKKCGTPKYGGRSANTRDSADAEPIVDIPLGYFTLLRLDAAGRPLRIQDIGACDALHQT